MDASELKWPIPWKRTATPNAQIDQRLAGFGPAGAHGLFKRDLPRGREIGLIYRDPSSKGPGTQFAPEFVAHAGHYWKKHYPGRPLYVVAKVAGDRKGRARAIRAKVFWDFHDDHPEALSQGTMANGEGDLMLTLDPWMYEPEPRKRLVRRRRRRTGPLVSRDRPQAREQR